MSQRNLIVANICNIRTPENGEWTQVKKLVGKSSNGTQAFVTLVEDYYNKNEEKMDKRYIPFSFFVPENMEIHTGQTVSAQYVVETYETEEGFTELGFRINRLSFIAGNKASTTGGHGVHMPEIEIFEDVIPDIEEETPFK